MYIGDYSTSGYEELSLSFMATRYCTVGLCWGLCGDIHLFPNFFSDKLCCNDQPRMSVSAGQLPKRGIAASHVSAFVIMRDLLNSHQLITLQPATPEGLFPTLLPTPYHIHFPITVHLTGKITLCTSDLCVCSSLCSAHPPPSGRWSSTDSALPRDIPSLRTPTVPTSIWNAPTALGQTSVIAPSMLFV